MLTSRTRTPARALAATVTALTLSSVLVACGGDDSDSAQEPAAPTTTATSETTASETPTATPTPSPTLRPLSRFEDRPQVRTARQWATAIARSVNDGDRQLGRVRKWMTVAGHDRMIGYAAEDAGLLYPGPLPFTPTGVRPDGPGRTRVPACMWVEGYAVDRQTKQPTKQRLVVPVDIFLERQQGTWKVDDLLNAEFDCSKTRVKARAFG